MDHEDRILCVVVEVPSGFPDVTLNNVRDALCDRIEYHARVLSTGSDHYFTFLGSYSRDDLATSVGEVEDFVEYLPDVKVRILEETTHNHSEKVTRARVHKRKREIDELVQKADEIKAAKEAL